MVFPFPFSCRPILWTCISHGQLSRTLSKYAGLPLFSLPPHIAWVGVKGFTHSWLHSFPPLCLSNLDLNYNCFDDPIPSSGLACGSFGDPTPPHTHSPQVLHTLLSQFYWCQSGLSSRRKLKSLYLICPRLSLIPGTVATIMWIW